MDWDGAPMDHKKMRRDLKERNKGMAVRKGSQNTTANMKGTMYL